MGKKDGMYLYSDWLAPFEKLDKAEVGELVIAMMRYFIYGEKPPAFKGLCGMAADFIFPQIDRSMEYAKLGSRGGVATREKTNAKKKETAKKKTEADLSFVDEPYEEFDAPMQQVTNDDLREKPCPKDPPETVKRESFEETYFKKQMLENHFYKFWREYPNKIDRQRAFEAFERLAPDHMLLNTMIDALKKQKKSQRWQKDNGQYIPYPANWIEGRRWEDKLDPIEKNDNKSEDKWASCETDEFFAAALRRAEEELGIPSST